MNVLITGGSGLLGQYLIKVQSSFFNVKSTHFNNPICDYKLDITDEDNIANVLEKTSPDVVIHCAGNGQVDYAEQHPQEARKVNFHGTVSLCHQCLKLNKPLLVYLSTNAVYEGGNPLYTEESFQSPVNEYGNAKSQIEDYLERHYKNHLIIRPYMLYGWNHKLARKNWATILYSRLRDNERTKLVDDVIWQPTYAEDCASAIWRIIGLYNRNHIKQKESFNISCGESVTLYNFGLIFCDVFGFDKDLIEPVSSDYFDLIANRPFNTSYDITKLTNNNIWINGIEEGLKRMNMEMRNVSN